MMIGDGLNDVLSLKAAGVGVSINAKSELNLMAADVIILNENLWKIPVLFNLMNLANRVVHINLVWAFAYNIFIARIYTTNMLSYCRRCLLSSWIYDISHDFICGDVHQFDRSCSDFQHNEAFQHRPFNSHLKSQDSHT
jgi:cation transport ATPase